ncbi:ATP-binding protein of ABC transporter [Crocosphaera subtropica ATCC 51142]|uniref:ATP-binding protein of ABC transporter n=1 Tax=Crocosphaera subtropica (strain ATCC 51142 / BH68) TaxID=43989 RepID=B1X0V0_CROS5|nr:ABC transporter ATP-binding protein [Crocosphaera subtropica]ACB52989.1 ATP-binding protein of ABC transporter [Crocosphaera subtropica ATCC 51142]
MIEVEHLSKIYGSTAAIEDVDFSVEKGEILGFLGPNGAGKTTTMRILSGYIPATTGTAKIAGYDVHENSLAVRRNIGYLPETPPLYPDMTVEGFLKFVARIKGVPSGDRHSRVNWSMERCQLEDKRKVLIRKLSKGYKQRVGIAQAIVHDPPVIILDEPTVGLDPKQIIEVRNLIKSLAGEHTILLSTHILPEVSMTCDRVTIINSGKVVATDTPDHLMSHLTAKGGYEIEIEGDIFSLEPLLRNLPGITQLEIKSNSQTKRHVLLLTTDSNQEIGKDIAALIVNQGLGLHEMKRTRATLEDVFLNLITEESSLDSQEEKSLETVDTEQTL